MLCRADSLGVFQVESRAQMNMLPRLQARACFYDLVIEVAIVRPGPIQGDMVHPYLRRRRGEEKVEFPSDALGDGAGQDPRGAALPGAGDADRDRRRRLLAGGGGPAAPGAGDVQEDRHASTPSASDSSRAWRANGYPAEFAERCFSQIEGFGEYGFPESHAASFALLVYASAWIKCHYPAVFACALLNSQPMGFYAPAQIVRDARAHGVEVRPVDVNASYWDNALEPDGRGGLALRLGFRQMKGMRAGRGGLDRRRRAATATRDVGAVWRRAGTPPRLLARARRGGRLRRRSGSTRREALWQVQAIGGEAPLPLFAGLEDEVAEGPSTLPRDDAGRGDRRRLHRRSG